VQHIDNVIIKTEVATSDDLHVDILDAVQKTLEDSLPPFSSKAVAFRYIPTSPLPAVTFKNRHAKDLAVFKASEAVEAHMTVMSGYITYFWKHCAKIIEK
jgi:hypothetical protein